MPAVRDTRRMSEKSGALVPVSPRLPNLARDRGNFFTRAGGAGDVYGEVVRTDESGARWRRWDPHRSKLAAALQGGALTKDWEDLLDGAPVVYLGAASGTTVSHVADLAAPKAVFAVELASRPFQELIVKLGAWANVFPVLADAREPGTYEGLVGKAQAIIQDVATSDQVAVLEANARALLPRAAPSLLFVKARSIDSSAEPARVFARARDELVGAGFTIRDERGLEPFDKDHRAFLVRWLGKAGGSAEVRPGPGAQAAPAATPAPGPPA